MFNMFSIKAQTLDSYRYHKSVKNTLLENSRKYHDKSMKHIAIAKNMSRCRLSLFSYYVVSLHDIYNDKIVPLSTFCPSNYLIGDQIWEE